MASKPKIKLNSTGEAWFMGFSFALFLTLTLSTIARYIKLEFYNKVFCPED